MLGSLENHIAYIVTIVDKVNQIQLSSGICTFLSWLLLALVHSSTLKEKEMWPTEILNYTVLQHRRPYSKWETICVILCIVRERKIA